MLLPTSRFAGAGKRRALGFTLIELVIVVAIVAILAAIAVPSYREYIRKGRRAEAMDALNAIVQLQERWRANNPTYATAAQLATITSSGTLPVASYYTITVPTNTARTYTIRAAATGAQAADTVCATMEVNQAGTRTPAECWNR